jgi:hypothetical protein
MKNLLVIIACACLAGCSITAGVEVDERIPTCVECTGENCACPDGDCTCG